MNIRQAVPFFRMADMAASLAFYVDGLGFRRTKEWTPRGVTPKHPFVGNNMWVVVVTDPDGYGLDFESETDVAEETIYDPAVHG